MTEGEDTRHAGLGRAGGEGGGVLGAQGVVGGGAVAPLVSHHGVVRVDHGGTPGGWGGGVGAPVVLNTRVGEGEDAGVVGLSSRVIFL